MIEDVHSTTSVDFTLFMEAAQALKDLIRCGSNDLPLMEVLGSRWTVRRCLPATGMNLSPGDKYTRRKKLCVGFPSCYQIKSSTLTLLVRRLLLPQARTSRASRQRMTTKARAMTRTSTPPSWTTLQARSVLQSSSCLSARKCPNCGA